MFNTPRTNRFLFALHVLLAFGSEDATRFLPAPLKESAGNRNGCASSRGKRYGCDE
jgi:hypothetical protein